MIGGGGGCDCCLKDCFYGYKFGVWIDIGLVVYNVSVLNWLHVSFANRWSKMLLCEECCKIDVLSI